MQKIIIVGNGISGITAARCIRKKSDAEILVISNESEYFFSRTALMYVYMGHMKWEHIEPYERNFWSKNRINLKKGLVTSFDFSEKLVFIGNERISYDKLILACGSKYKEIGITGENTEGIFGMYSKQDFDQIWNWTKGAKWRAPKIKKAAVIGGGLIGIELVEMLHSEGIHVDFIIRDGSFWSGVLPSIESEIVTKHILSKGINMITNEGINEIHSTEGKISGLTLNSGDVLNTEMLGVTIGVEPNISFLQNSGLKLDKGILVNQRLETNQKDVFAVGDCAQLEAPDEGRKAIEPVWYTGRMMGEVAAISALGLDAEYHPGVWFNSAKFFDIEYQVYGYIPIKEKDGLKNIVFRRNDDVLRFVFENDKLVGVQGLGIRIKHEIAEKYILNGANEKELTSCWKELLFDPEFYAMPTLATN